MKVIPFLFLMFACSCNTGLPKKITIVVFNNSNSDLDSVRIVGAGIRDTVQNLRSLQRIERDVMLNDHGNHEGGFGLSIYVQDSLVGGGQFGYYDSPSFAKSKYNVEIQRDFTLHETQ
jgi:hypothetical protein